jgi:hypothetical protein
LLEVRRFTICPFYQFATSASNCCQDRYEEILPKITRCFGYFPFKPFPLNNLQIAPKLVHFIDFLWGRLDFRHFRTSESIKPPVCRQLLSSLLDGRKTLLQIISPLLLA